MIFSKTNGAILFIFCFCTHILLGQGKPYTGPEDPAGDIAAEREGFMNGNRILLFSRTPQNYQIGRQAMYPLA